MEMEEENFDRYRDEFDENYELNLLNKQTSCNIKTQEYRNVKHEYEEEKKKYNEYKNNKIKVNSDNLADQLLDMTCSEYIYLLIY
jgi:hypothetical protein